MPSAAIGPIVGAYNDGNSGPGSHDGTGAAYVYAFDGIDWTLQQRITASDAASGDAFGYAVSISDSAAVVGAPGENEEGTYAGAAYVFRCNGSEWVQEDKLTASDAAASSYFGGSVCVGDGLTLVGAFNDGNTGPTSYDGTGAAYVFRFDGAEWVEEDKLTASDAEPGDYLGWSVSLDDEMAVLGAMRDDDACPEIPYCDSGSAYVFRLDRSEWVEEAKLTASDGEFLDNFGESVSISGEAIVIGAGGDDDGGPSAGAAYVYRLDGDTWLDEDKIIASDAEAGDAFGSDVAVDGDVALIGAYGNDDAGYTSGSAYVYVFHGVGWIEHDKVIASDGTTDYGFGDAVALDGDLGVIGAPAAGFGDSRPGLAYTYTGLSACLPESVDLADHALFIDCMAGPDTTPAPTTEGVTVQDCLDWFDLDDTDDVDLCDFAMFELVFTAD